MKTLYLLRASISLLVAAREASAQGVVSHLGGFLEQNQQVAAVGAEPDPLSLFLGQQEPSFPVAAQEPPATGIGAPVQSAPVPPASQQWSAIPPPAPLQPVVQNMAADLHYATPISKPKGLLTLRSMRVSNSGADGSKIHFGMNNEFSMGTDSAGNFVVQKATESRPLFNLDSQNTLHLGGARVEAGALDAQNGFAVRGVSQWSLLYSDDFSAGSSGWSRGEVSQCGGVFMLGGSCKLSVGEVNKTFTGLPPHKQLRVVAKYHFIDRWIGETGYMKLNVGHLDCDVPVWTEQHKQETGKGVNLCGDASVAEGKFSAPVEVTIPHSKDSVTVTFGSTIGEADPCDESWGISAVEIYFRA